MDRVLEVFAPAKVNLLLKILAKLPSGYHAINSLIARTDLCDRLEVCLDEKATEINFSCEYSEMLRVHYPKSNKENFKDLQKISSQENIVVKAAKLFIQHFQLSQDFGLKIKLHKNIPFGAGLGGGSADAAALINALYRMTGVKASTVEMLDLAKKLGADVPAMLFEQMVFVEGIGEKVSLLESLKPKEYPDHLPCVILKPCFSIATELAYQKISLSLELQILDEKQAVKLSEESRALLESLQLSRKKLYLEQTPYNYLTFSRQEGSSPQRKSGYLEKYLALFENDFEKVAYGLDPRYRGHIEILKGLGALKVLLAGSGSSLIAFMPSWEQACEMAVQAAQISPEGTFVVPARVLL